MFVIREVLSLDNIRERISDATIFRYIFPNFTNLYKKFSVRQEKTPSASIIQGKRDLLFRDFGDPNQVKAESWYEYLSRTRFNGNTIETLNWVNRTFNLSLGVYKSNSVSVNTVKTLKSIPSNINTFNIRNNPVIIKIKSRKFSPKDFKYWSQYGVSIPKLKEKNIKALSYFWINDSIYDVRNTLCYSYWLGKINNISIYKIYQPLSKVNKWKSNSNKNVIQNINNIPESGNLLILQSSYKDIMCMEELGDYNCIATNSENIIIPPKLMDYLKLRWNKIIYFANNDYPKTPNTGLMIAKKYKELYNIDFITTPDGFSDISDYYKYHGRHLTNRLLKIIL